MNLGQNSFRFWYYRFKDSPYFPLSLVTAMIVVGVVLLFRVIIPQVSEWFSLRGEIEATNQRIEVLKQNINFMNNLDRGKLSADIDTVMAALPSVKDFGGILQAVSASSLKAGVSLEDYSFQVGGISTGSAEMAARTKMPQEDSLSKVELKVTIMGTIEGVRNFLEEIEEKLPIGEVIALKSNSQFTTLEIVFYVKDFPQVSFQAGQEIVPLSDSERLLLQRLGSWKSSGEVVGQGGDVQVDQRMPLF